MGPQPHPVTCISQGQRPRKPCWRRSCYLGHPLSFFSSLANKGVISASPHPTWPDVAFGCLSSSDPAHGKVPSLRLPCPLPGTRQHQLMEPAVWYLLYLSLLPGVVWLSTQA